MSQPFLSEIKIVSFSYAPKNWTMCNGQLLPINQNQALFSLIGTTYGGNGQTTFALPDLRGRVPIHLGQGFVLGQKAGEQTHTLTISEMPTHFHGMMGKNGASDLGGGQTPGPAKALAQGKAAATGAPDVNIFGTGAPNQAMSPATITNAGGSQAHQNMQPFLALTFCIALTGIFPSQN